jgi:S1-C subfamily serine protease
MRQGRQGNLPLFFFARHPGLRHKIAGSGGGGAAHGEQGLRHLTIGSRLAAVAVRSTLPGLFSLFLSTSLAMADNATQCKAGIGSDGKLHSGADAGKVAEACLAAAGNGDAQAYYRAGLVLEQGIGGHKDTVKAEDWYRKAAGKGEVEAQLALGRLAEAQKKPDIALGWYSRAALKNSKAGQDALQRLRLASPKAMWDAALYTIEIDPSLGSDSDFKKWGSGIVIAPDMVLTNEHVVASCTQMAVAPGLPARVLATDADKDLAVIKTTIPLGAPVAFASDKTLPADMPLYTGGYPEVDKDTDAALFVMTTGQISPRKIDPETGRDYWMLTNQIHPGNSGGPLFDDSGRVVGVIAAERPITGIVKKTAAKDGREGMAVRAEWARAFLDKNGIAYTTADKGPVANAAADMERHAAAATVLVECFE